MKTTFDYQVGDLVDLFRDWEKAVVTNTKIVNRRLRWTNSGSERTIAVEYMLEDGSVAMEHEVKLSGR